MTIKERYPKIDDIPKEVSDVLPFGTLEEEIQAPQAEQLTNDFFKDFNHLKSDVQESSAKINGIVEQLLEIKKALENNNNKFLEREEGVKVQNKLEAQLKTVAEQIGNSITEVFREQQYIRERLSEFNGLFKNYDGKLESIINNINNSEALKVDLSDFKGSTSTSLDLLKKDFIELGQKFENQNSNFLEQLNQLKTIMNKLSENFESIPSTVTALVNDALNKFGERFAKIEEYFANIEKSIDDSKKQIQELAKKAKASKVSLTRIRARNTRLRAQNFNENKKRIISNPSISDGIIEADITVALDKIDLTQYSVSQMNDMVNGKFVDANGKKIRISIRDRNDEIVKREKIRREKEQVEKRKAKIKNFIEKAKKVREDFLYQSSQSKDPNTFIATPNSEQTDVINMYKPSTNPHAASMQEFMDTKDIEDYIGDFKNFNKLIEAKRDKDKEGFSSIIVELVQWLKGKMVKKLKVKDKVYNLEEGEINSLVDFLYTF